MSQETIEVRYRELTPMSRQMFEDGRSVNAGTAKGAYFFAPYPITLRRGKGCVLEDVDGRSYVDFSNHHTAQVLGHNHPAIVEAVERQLVDGIALGAATGVETRLARMMWLYCSDLYTCLSDPDQIYSQAFAINDRRALFTDSELGKCCFTSGSSMTEPSAGVK